VSGFIFDEAGREDKGPMEKVISDLVAYYERHEVTDQLRDLEAQLGSDELRRTICRILDVFRSHPLNKERPTSVDLTLLRGKNVELLLARLTGLEVLLRLQKRDRDHVLDFQPTVTERTKDELCEYLRSHWRPVLRT
jgi:hypothetical protein